MLRVAAILCLPAGHWWTKGVLTMTGNLMRAEPRRFTPAYDRLRFAIDRFLAGKLTPMQLQSWCYAHFEQPQPHVSEHEQQLWQLTMLNLAVFHRCDFHRSALEQSLALLLAAVNANGIPCATPLTTSECWHEMTRRERRHRDPGDQRAAIEIGQAPCH
jgi:hypothetical protein